MIRRTYKILGETDQTITRLSKEMKVDKEHIVQMALDAGLPEVEKWWERIGKPSGLDVLRKELLGGKEERIKAVSKKRRA